MRFGWLAAVLSLGVTRTESQNGQPDAPQSRLTFRVSGMTCAGCASSVERAVSKSDNVKSASVSYALGRAIVSGEDLENDEVVETIRRAGFDAEPLDGGASVVEARRQFEQKQQQHEHQWRRRAIVAISLWVPMALLHWLGPAVGLEGPWVPWVLLTASTAALIFAGGGFYSSAFKAAKHGSTNMDTLIALGASAAYAFSTVIFASRLFGSPIEQPLYFGEVAALLGIISLGHWLEARASNRANSAVRDLLNLQPESAEQLDSVDSDAGVTVPVASIVPGDLLLIRPGSRIAVDGAVERGESEVDESLVTGEPIPVSRCKGDSVVAGSMNTTGRLIVRATVDGTSTTVARIAELVNDAQSSKARIQRVADHVCSIFVPSVMSIALATVLGWWLVAGDPATGVIAAVTVLIISCPCALGLATPIAVMVGTGEASRSGLLVKNASVLEAAARIGHIIFDKTGTLTAGRPQLETIDILDDAWDEDDILKLAATVEKPSEHPVALAIVEAAEARGIETASVDLFEALPGKGVRGLVGDANVEVLRDEAASCRVIVNDETIARLHIADVVRDDAAITIRALEDLGLSITLLSGDRHETVEAVGTELGLSAHDLEAETSPQEKLTYVRRLVEQRTRGDGSTGTIAMVGDGINDAAALAAADVGIAMSSGTNIAMESADVVVLNDYLESVPRVIVIARHTLRTIRQNLFLAFIYNATAIPLAAFGLLGEYGPLWAAAAMGLSDISVVGNALRLKRKLATTARRA